MKKILNVLSENLLRKTGYTQNTFEIIQNILPYEEYFTGSNLKSYKHKYYLAYIKDDNLVTHNYQKSEVSQLRWCTYEECKKIIRPYNIEKKKNY